MVIDEDDIYRYAGEETTAFRFIESFLHVDMKHILAKSVSRKDPRQLFQVIDPGTLERDMANFRINIENLIHAQNAEVPEQQKFAYFKELLTHDTRQYLANALDLARFNKLNFESTVDLLITTHSNQPADPEELQIFTQSND